MSIEAILDELREQVVDLPTVEVGHGATVALPRKPRTKERDARKQTPRVGCPILRGLQLCNALGGRHRKGQRNNGARDQPSLVAHGGRVPLRKAEQPGAIKHLGRQLTAVS